MDFKGKRGADKTNILKTGGIFLVSVIGLSFFLFVIIICIIFLKFSLTGDDGIASYEHQYFQYNPFTEESTFGFLSLQEEYGLDEYDSFTDEDGNYNLVSSLGSSEYKCTGSCFCDDERRSSSVALSRGMLYFAAGVSSFVVYGRAKDHFHEECVKQHSEFCSASSIKSDVDSCQRVTGISDKNKENGELSTFWCQGSCKTSEGLDNPIEMYLAEDFGCEHLDAEGEVTVENTGGSLNDVELMNSAKLQFKELHLEEFCQNHSHHEYEGESHDGYILDDASLFLCVSGGPISCRKIPSTN